MMANVYGGSDGAGDEANGGAIQDYRIGGGRNGGKPSSNGTAKPGGPLSCCSKLSIMSKIAIVVGMMFLIASLITAGLQLGKHLSWSKTTGVVVAVEYCGGRRILKSSGSKSSSGGSSSSGPTYRPTIEYTVVSLDEEGFEQTRTYTFTSGTCSFPGPSVGDIKSVIYDPENPQNAMDAGFDAWLVPTILGGMGLSIVVLACITSKYSRSGGRNSSDRDGHDDHYDTGQGGGNGWFGGGGGCAGGGGDCGDGVGGDCGGGGGD